MRLHFKVLLQYLIDKHFFVMYFKGLARILPGDDVLKAFGIRILKHLMQFSRKAYNAPLLLLLLLLLLIRGGRHGEDSETLSMASSMNEMCALRDYLSELCGMV